MRWLGDGAGQDHHARLLGELCAGGLKRVRAAGIYDQRPVVLGQLAGECQAKATGS